jgi:phosphoenolpyruvate carboxylase
MSKCMKRYGDVVEALAPLVNSLSAYVPQRRARKLHIGLFGYSRKIGGISLPRAIPFAAALYSIGIPPEIIGCKALDELNDEEWDLVKKYYVNCSHDLVSIGGYVSWDNINMLLETHEQASAKANMSVEKLETALTKILEDLKTVEEKLVIKLGPRTPSQKRHGNFTNNFLISYLERDNPEEARLDLIEAAKIRKCLG